MAIDLAVTRARPAPSQAGPLHHLLADRQLFVASNRGPIHYRMRDGQVEAAPVAGGLVTALSSLTDHLPATWVSTATGSADRLMASYHALNDPAPAAPRLRFVDTSEDALRWFYTQFANPVLWFLQHHLWNRLQGPDIPEVIERGWHLGYEPLNLAHAAVLASEIGHSRHPVVLVHDYHLYLVPSLLRRKTPRALISHFTHIPWPSPGYWQPLPPAMRRQLCEGLLGANVAGFQTVESAHNFLRCSGRFVPGALVDYENATVTHRGRTTVVRDYPISVDSKMLRRMAADPRADSYKARLRPRENEMVIVRVDRLDPSKNVALGFRAFGNLLERRPDLVGRVRFRAFLVPTRDAIPEYQQYAREVWEEVDRVNGRFSRPGWKPIEVYYEENRLQAIAGMSQADVLLVNPVADGMNLVAKEGPVVAERDMVLVLSETCGAHAQLGRAAVSVPPLDVDATASALEHALEMPEGERAVRLAALRRAVEGEDLIWWAERQVEDLLGSESYS